jgi:DNA ligase-1
MAFQVMLSKSWEDQDPSGWWMSEKLDGVRSYWDGEEFRSRNGNIFAAPDWFKKGMPKQDLDGELWTGRGDFETVSGIVRTKVPGPGWKKVKYLIFDAPKERGGFEDRLDRIGRLPAHAKKLAQKKCRSKEDLVRFLRSIEDQGGEGVMLRRAGSAYERKRSSALLKVKTFFDAEAEVVGRVPGQGKFEGMMGALDCVSKKDTRSGLKAGVHFQVGTGFSDAQRRRPPKNGDVITFRFQELTSRGIPRFPSFVAVRDYE